VGEVGVVSGDFHRLKSAAANESRKNSQSNQVICAFFFFKQALTLFMKWSLGLQKFLSTRS
jgi:hypothetical protein